MRGDAAVERDQMLSDAQERADIAGAQFAATARALRETVSSLASHLTTGHSDSQYLQVQRLRGHLSEQADTLRTHREDVSVYSAELADSYRVVKAVSDGDITTLSKIEEGASYLVQRARETMAATEARFQQLLAPFFRNDLPPAELKAAADEMSSYLQSQIRDAANALTRARKVRAELEDSMAGIMHEQASASARTRSGTKPRRAADVFAEIGATSFPT
jgi:chromosome segregation ATPase